MWGTSQRLQKKYGQRRVFDTPLSEGAIIGTAVGVAMTGLRPIAEIMYFDFITVAMNPLNQCAMLRFMSGKQLKIPLVVFAQFVVANVSGDSPRHRSCDAAICYGHDWL